MRLNLLRVRKYFKYLDYFGAYAGARILWILPLILSVVRLKQLGFFSGMTPPLTGTSGSPFYGFVGVARLLMDHPQGLPAVIHEVGFPEGVPASSLPYLFGEPHWRLALNWILAIKRDPVWAVWFAGVLGILFNIWGTWWILWKRMGEYSAGAMTLSWAVLCLSSWPWTQTLTEFNFCWIPWFLLCTLFWWDVLVRQRTPSFWKGLFVHLALLSQSIAYGVLLICLVTLWTLVSFLQRWHLNTNALRKFGILFFAALCGFGIDALWIMKTTGSFQSLFEMSSVASQSAITAGMGSIPFRNFLGASFPVLPKFGLLITLLFAGLKLRPQIYYALSGFVFFILLGSSEWPFLREGVLRHLFPFVHSYSTVAMPLLCIAAIWVSECWAKFLRREARRMRWMSGIIVVSWLSLLLGDYGWPQPLSRVQTQPLCKEIYDVVKQQNVPVLFQSLLPEGHEKCATPGESINAWELYALSGMPQLNRPGEIRVENLIPESSACVEWKKRLLAANKQAVAVLWWFEGTQIQWEDSLKCIHPESMERVYEADRNENGWKLILSRIRVPDA